MSEGQSLSPWYAECGSGGQTERRSLDDRISDPGRTKRLVPASETKQSLNADTPITLRRCQDGASAEADRCGNTTWKINQKFDRAFPLQQ